jgi:hypothetical protein
MCHRAAMESEHGIAVCNFPLCLGVVNLETENLEGQIGCERMREKAREGEGRRERERERETEGGRERRPRQDLK